MEATKDSYQVGDKFNAADVKVSAIYKVGDTETLRKLIDPTDGDLKFTGFDSATAGTKTITVSYRGVNATFEVTVTATGGHSRPWRAEARRYQQSWQHC